MSLFEEPVKDAQYYLDLIGDWEDPYEPPKIVRHEGINVVRDDLLLFGSKARFLDYLVKTSSCTKFVFGACPANGYAQISLPAVAKRYGKEVHLFMAERDPTKYTKYQKMGIAGGAIYHWVPDGMLNVTKARAREFAEIDPDDRMVFPLGLEHETVLASIIKVARKLPTPKEFWSVGSSGTLNRGLQLAWPDANANVVQVGHNMSEREIGRAKHWKSDLSFDRPAKILPPFPSAPTYDAKAWEFIIREASEDALFWNVGA